MFYFPMAPSQEGERAERLTNTLLGAKDGGSHHQEHTSASTSLRRMIYYNRPKSDPTARQRYSGNGVFNIKGAGYHPLIYLFSFPFRCHMSPYESADRTRFRWSGFVQCVIKEGTIVALSKGVGMLTKKPSS